MGEKDSKMITGTIAYLESGSFKGKNGEDVPFVQAVVDGVKYQFYGKAITEKKIGDSITFEKIDKGEGKTPGGRLAGEDAPKKQWQKQDSDAMYRCNASDKATQIIIQLYTMPVAEAWKPSEVWDMWYDHIYAKMKGDVPVVDKVTTTVGSEKATPTGSKNPTAPKATGPQKNTIMNKALGYKMDVGNFITEALKYDCHIEDLSKGEASLVITYWNDKEAKGDEPF